MAPRFAVILHGRVGTLRLKPHVSIRRRSAVSPRLIRLCSESIRQHVVRPNAADVFVHSWNPEQAALLDAEFGAVRSKHEPPVPSLPKSASQSLSIARAAELADNYARAKGSPYALLLVLRLDLVVAAPIRLDSLDAGLLWFPQRCCTRDVSTVGNRWARCNPGSADNESTWQPARVVSHCRVSSYGKPDTRRSLSVELGYSLQDWAFAARAATVRTWGDIARQWTTYLRQLEALHLRTASAEPWAHSVWAVHIHDVLNRTAELRFAPWRITLGRNAYVQLFGAQASLLKHGCPLDAVHIAPLELGAKMTVSRTFGRYATVAGQCPQASTRPRTPCCAAIAGRPHWRSCTGGIANATSARRVQEAACRSGRAALWEAAMRTARLANEPPGRETKAPGASGRLSLTRAGSRVRSARYGGQ